MTTDTELLTFTVRWLPYGGPPAEDVFVTFGLTYEQFRARIAEAVVRERRHITLTTACALLQLSKSAAVEPGAARERSVHGQLKPNDVRRPRN